MRVIVRLTDLAVRPTVGLPMQHGLDGVPPRMPMPFVEGAAWNLPVNTAHQVIRDGPEAARPEAVPGRTLNLAAR